MNTEQNYDVPGTSTTPVEPAAPQIGQTVHTPRLTADLALLRQYLDQVFYPWVFRPLTAGPKSDEPTKDDNNPFGDFSVDLSDFDIDLSGFDVDLSDFNIDRDDEGNRKDDTPEDFFAYYTPIQRVLMMHRLFVVFCGHRQADWWDAYIAELIHFFGECGETKLIVAITLREPEVMQTLRPFCS